MKKTWKNLLAKTTTGSGGVAGTASACTAGSPGADTPHVAEPCSNGNSRVAETSSAEDYIQVSRGVPTVTRCADANSSVPAFPTYGEVRRNGRDISSGWVAVARGCVDLKPRVEDAVTERASLHRVASIASTASGKGFGLGKPSYHTPFGVGDDPSAASADSRSRMPSVALNSSIGPPAPSVSEKSGRRLVKTLGRSFSSGDLTRLFLHRSGQNRKDSVDESQLVSPTRSKTFVFGVRLSDIPHAATTFVTVGERKDCCVPVFLERCTRFLLENGTSVTGIFRVCGSLRRVAELQGKFDAQPTFGRDVNIRPGGEYTVHDVASAVRRYLNELPEPVICKNLYGVFRATYNELWDDEDAQVERYKAHILDLPPEHRDVLAFVIDALAVFASHADATLMPVENLAAVFQPSLLNHPDHCTDPGEYMRNQRIIATLIQRSSDLFGSPIRRTKRAAQSRVPQLLPLTTAESLSTEPALPCTSLRRKPATRQARCRQREMPQRCATLLPEKRRSSSKVALIRRSATVHCVSFHPRAAADIADNKTSRRSSYIDVRHALDCYDLFGSASPRVAKALNRSASWSKVCPHA